MDGAEQTTNICENCSISANASHKFCPNCGFPIGGMEQEKASFRLTVRSRQRFLKDANKQIKNAKYIIYALAGLFLLVGLFQGFAADDFGGMIVNLVLSLMYLILASWADKNAFGAILTAFIVYITVHIINGIIDPLTIFQGLLMKVIFIGAFVKGIQSALEANRLMNELEKFKAVPIGEE